MEIKQGGFYLSPTAVDRIIAALERFNAAVDFIFPKESGPGDTGQLEERKLTNMCS